MGLLNLYFSENLKPIKSAMGLNIAVRPLHILLNENIFAWSFSLDQSNCIVVGSHFKICRIEVENGQEGASTMMDERR